jgi:hypothetical protein
MSLYETRKKQKSHDEARLCLEEALKYAEEDEKKEDIKREL